MAQTQITREEVDRLRKAAESETAGDEWNQLKQKSAPILTRGQQVMSVSFNPGQREDVAAIKQIFADAYDEIEKWVDEAVANPKTNRSEAFRLAEQARQHLETAQMYAVKAVTR